MAQWLAAITVNSTIITAATNKLPLSPYPWTHMHSNYSGWHKLSFLLCITPSMVERIPRRLPNLCQINKKSVLDSVLPIPTPREQRFKFIVLIVIAKEGRLPSEKDKDFHMPIPAQLGRPG